MRLSDLQAEIEPVGQDDKQGPSMDECGVLISFVLIVAVLVIVLFAIVSPRSSFRVALLTARTRVARIEFDSAI